MKTILAISSHAEFAQTLRAALSSGDVRVMSQKTIQEDALRLMAPAIDVCVCETDSNAARPLRAAGRLREILPNCPILICCDSPSEEFLEEALAVGVNQVVAKRGKGRGLAAALRIALAASVAPAEAAPPPPPGDPRVVAEGAGKNRAMSLEFLRQFPSMLSPDRSVGNLLAEFLQELRREIGVNRAAIFLRDPPGARETVADSENAPKLRAVVWAGLPPSMMETFELSLGSGLGGRLLREGRVLRRDSAEVKRDAPLRQEMDLLSARVAIPLLDHGSLVGLVVFDDRVTGEPHDSQELQRVFQLLESLAACITRIWLNKQISGERDLLSEVLHKLSGGYVVIGRDLTILYANPMARKRFGSLESEADTLEFSGLPEEVASRVRETLKTGAAQETFRYVSNAPKGAEYEMSVLPFQEPSTGAGGAALLLIEDCSHADQLRDLEVETANLRLIQGMAERMAHEIGNAVLPLSTHQQLLKERSGDAEFQESLAGALEEGVKRVSRLVSQMRYLARDHVEPVETTPVRKLLEDAFREARVCHPGNSARLHLECSEPLAIVCDRAALQHAFGEIFLNAIQAGVKPAQVQVRAFSEAGPDGSRWVSIEMEDNGPGFTVDAARDAAKAFFSTRNVGLGLGLAVANKIIQNHGGKLAIPSPEPSQPGLVRVSLPLKPATSPPSNGAKDALKSDREW